MFFSLFLFIHNELCCGECVYFFRFQELQERLVDLQNSRISSGDRQIEEVEAVRLAQEEVYIHSSSCTLVHTHTHTLSLTYIHTYTQTHIHTCMHIYIHNHPPRRKRRSCSCKWSSSGSTRRHRGNCFSLSIGKRRKQWRKRIFDLQRV